MKLIKILLFLFIGILFISCDMKEYKTDKFELRQLVNEEQVSQNSHGSYFLIMADYSSNTKYTEKIKVLANINNQYRFLEFDMKSIRIVIDNKISKPQIQWFYTSDLEKDLETLVDYYDDVIIYCPEQYLPEKLLPIKLK